jgi:hypothetical protein
MVEVIAKSKNIPITTENVASENAIPCEFP